MKKLYLSAVMLLFVLATGCRTHEYYQDQAVQQARRFLLKKSPQLTFEESSYIRYNKPVILHSNIVGGTDDLTSSRILSNMNQIQIVWHVPGDDKFYVVWGACSASLRDFSPERLFVRKFYPKDRHRENALKRARAYIIGNLFSTLSVEDYNDLRFRDPEIHMSEIDVEDELMPGKGQMQFTFVWKQRTNPENMIIVIGNARKNLADFAPVSGALLPASDVTPNLREQYKNQTPQKFISPENTEAAPSPADEDKNPSPAPAAAEKEKITPAPAAQKEKITPPKADPIITNDKNLPSVEIAPETGKLLEEESKKTIKPRKKVDLPPPPVLDTENDLKEPEK